MTTLVSMVVLMVASLGLLEDVPPVPVSKADTDRVSSSKVDEILTRLEKRSDGITDIRCTVRLREDDRLNLSERVKDGRILFLIADPNPRFLVHFEKTRVDETLGKQEWYLFDGYWLFQGLERTERVTHREIARQGESVDLFDIETAPFPLPFGQKKDKILRHFDVRIVPPAKTDPTRTDHLVCVPKPGSRLERKYDKLEFFVREDLNLPVRVVATRNSGLEVITADFPNLSEKSINTGLTKKHFSQPREWKGYELTVEPLEPVKENPKPESTGS